LVEKGTATIPLRVGRIDAVEAGPPGAPGSKTDLETTLTRFETAGFNQSDAIVLTYATIRIYDVEIVANSLIALAATL
jgi:hypothetical protein